MLGKTWTFLSSILGIGGLTKAILKGAHQEHNHVFNLNPLYPSFLVLNLSSSSF